MNICNVADFKMYCESTMEEYRCRTFWDKEPETIAWIQSFQDGEVFYDIGANVGIYSLYASSIHPNLKVYAFEPVPLNYDRFVDNIELNSFHNIMPFPTALGSETKKQTLYIPDNDVGTSGSQIEEPIDEYGTEFIPAKTVEIQQGTLDDSVSIVQQPNHIKIDVDGHENEILRGGLVTLRNPYLKSVLVECNQEKLSIETVVEFMFNLDFTVENELNDHPYHSRGRRGGNPENIIFTRS